MSLSSDSVSNSSRKPRLLLLVTEYAYFLSHKLPLATAASEAGFDVFVAARCKDGAASEPSVGHAFEVIPLPWKRRGSILGAALKLVPEVLTVRRVLAEVRPDVVHCISLKPAIVGALAAYRRPVRVIHSINGFGFVFYAKSLLARAVQVCCGAILRHSVVANGGRIILQNQEDFKFVACGFGVPEERLTLIRGSGVDPADFESGPEPASPPVIFLILSRLLFMKGHEVAIEAFKILKTRGVNAELVICGAPDPGNPSSIPQDVLDEWSQIPGVTFQGQVEDVRPVLRASHVVVHPALGGEGLPRALLEAAAMGRPMIASDIGGNREVVVHEQTGLLAPLGESLALADAMERLAEQPENRCLWGQAAHQKVVAELSSEKVRQSHVELYSQALQDLRRDF